MLVMYWAVCECLPLLARMTALLLAIQQQVCADCCLPSCPPAWRSPLLYEMNRVLFNNGRGNEEFANLPRKLNICISPTRDDFPHTQVCWHAGCHAAMAGTVHGFDDVTSDTLQLQTPAVLLVLP